MCVNKGKKYHVNNINDSKNDTEYAYANFFKLRYSLNAQNVELSPPVKLWELQFLSNMKKVLQEYSHPACDNEYGLSISYAVSSSIDLEMEENLKLDEHLITGTFVIIFIMASILMSLGTTCITSPGMILPMAGIYSALFGLSSAFGLLSLIGFKNCNLSFTAPFLVIGVGIDDMFIIYSAYMNCLRESKVGRYQDIDLSDLISKTMMRSGVSITITSLTDFSAFMVGLIADFPSVQIFCAYIGVSILFCYLYQLTIFAGFLCVHTVRIKKVNKIYVQ